MTEEITDRIRRLMQEYNLSPSAFADEIGIQRPAISHILSGRNRPSLDVVMKILKAFDQINPQWLLTGEGTMKQLNLFDDTSKESNKHTDNKEFEKETSLESPVADKPLPPVDTAHSQPVQPAPSDFSGPVPTPLVSSSKETNYVQSPEPPTERVGEMEPPAYMPPPPHHQSAYQRPMYNQEFVREPEHAYSQSSASDQHAPYRPYKQYAYPDSNQHIENQKNKSKYGLTEALFGEQDGKKIERIVMFFDDKTFTVYTPEDS